MKTARIKFSPFENTLSLCIIISVGGKYHNFKHPTPDIKSHVLTNLV